MLKDLGLSLKLDFPLKPKGFFSPSLEGLSDLSLLKDLGLSLKLDFPLKPKLFFLHLLKVYLSLLKDLGLFLDFPLKPKGFFSPSLEGLSDLSLLKDLGLSLKLEVRSRLPFP